MTGWPGVQSRVDEDETLLIERDVAVPMRDGVEIRVDVFRPVDASTALPVLLAWSPYGKHGNVKWDSPLFSDYDLGFDTSERSQYTPFEYPDPTWWCAHEYAVVFADMRGTWGSHGDATYWSQQEALDGYDTIEWASAQPWSNSKVGLIGCSNLAWAQWYIAATRPPHLAAINPWEGVSDFYREFAFHGGIPETNFVNVWHALASFSQNQVEDIPAAAAAHPLLDEYWMAKGPDLSKIDVPAFVAASWSDHGLHTRGSLEGYRRISSADKWLLIHGGKKWAAQYSPQNLDRQLAFFDRFVKGLGRTPVDDWPRITMEVRRGLSPGVFREEKEWPPQRTLHQKLFLDEAGLSRTKPASTGSVRYDGVSGCATFDFTFEHATEITGYMSLRVWFTADEAEDADIFVAVQKLDTSGAEVPFHFFSVQEDGHVALGWLRASHRELDTALSTPEQPVHTHRAIDPLPADGQPVPLDIEIWPSSTLFDPGETLRLVVQGRDVNSYPPMTPNAAHAGNNSGVHTIHTGGQYDSFLLVPVIPDVDS